MPMSHVFPTARQRAWLLVLVWTLLHAFALRHELTITTVDLNDNVYHYTLAARMVQALESGENPLDCWVSEWSFGYPVSRTYQPLGHIVPALTHLALGKSLSLLTIFVWIRYLLLCLFPLTIYYSSRLLHLDRPAAVAAALVAPLLSTQGLYGLEYGSFLWRGSGLYTQAWAMHLLPLTLGWAFRAVQSGRGLVRAGVLLALTFLAHVIYGYMAALSVCLLALLPHAQIPRLPRFARLGGIALVALSLSAFFLLPVLLDMPLINRSRWQPDWQWDSLGLGPVFTHLVTGGLLDFGRWPVLTVLALIGAVIGTYRLRQPLALPPSTAHASRRFAYGFLLSGTVLWILLFGGRPTWGVLLTMLGIGSEFHLHRFIGGAHLFLLFLIGIGLGSVWAWGLARRNWWQRSIVLLGTLLVLAPALIERAHYLLDNATWGRHNLRSVQAEAHDLQAVLTTLQQRPGRTYPGLAAAWGGQFKVGQVQLFSFLSTHHIPAIAFLYHSLALTSDIMVRFDEDNPAHYRLFNIRTVLADADTPLPTFLTPLAQHGRFRLLTAPDSHYFELVSVPYAVQTNKRQLYDIIDPWFGSDWVAKRQHLLLDINTDTTLDLPILNAPPFPAVRAATGLGVVKQEAKSGERYQAHVQVAQDSFLLFKMTYHPNWRVSVNGHAHQTVMLSPGFVGIRLSPGTYQVAIVYQAEGWKMPLLWAGICVCLLAGLAERRGAVTWTEKRLALVWTRAYTRWQTSLAVQRGVIAGGLIILALPVCLPLLTTQLPGGHASQTYFPRLIEFHENIHHGILLPRWAPDLSDGYGQPFFLFNPPLLYYIAEIWHLLGLTVVTALNLACVALVLVAGVGMLGLGRLYGGPAGGWLAATAYLYAPYFQLNIFVRHAWDEVCALACYPLILYGFGRAARHRQPGWILVGGVAYAALLWSHQQAAWVFTPVLLAYVCFQAWQAHSWFVLRRQLVGVGLGLGAGAAIWLPAFAESASIFLDRAIDDYFQYTHHFVYPHQFVSATWGYGLSVAGYQDALSLSLGWSQLGILALAVLWFARSVDQNNLFSHTSWRFFSWTTVAMCFGMLPGAVWLWDQIPLLAYVQFPWRLLGPASVGVGVLMALLAPALSQRRVWISGALSLLILANIGHSRPQHFVPVDLTMWAPSQLAQRGISVTARREYEPRWRLQHQAFRTDALRVIQGAAEVTDLDRTPIDWSAQVTAQHETRLEAACTYFPGWQVLIDGQTVPMTIAEPSGLIQFVVPAGTHTVSLQFRRTWPRWVGEGIGLVAVLSILGLGWRWRSTGSQNGNEKNTCSLTGAGDRRLPPSPARFTCHSHPLYSGHILRNTVWTSNASSSFFGL